MPCNFITVARIIGASAIPAAELDGIVSEREVQAQCVSALRSAKSRQDDHLAMKPCSVSLKIADLLVGYSSTNLNMPHAGTTTLPAPGSACDRPSQDNRSNPGHGQCAVSGFKFEGDGRRWFCEQTAGNGRYGVTMGTGTWYTSGSDGFQRHLAPDSEFWPLVAGRANNRSNPGNHLTVVSSRIDNGRWEIFRVEGQSMDGFRAASMYPAGSDIADNALGSEAPTGPLVPGTGWDVKLLQGLITQ